MKKTLFLVCMVLLTAIPCWAQNNEIQAFIEFEKAETAYNEGNYTAAVQALNKTQEFLGIWTPKVSHLKILSLDRLYRKDRTPYVADLQKEITLYMNWSDNNTENVDTDKFREVYAVNENVIASEQNRANLGKSYPQDFDKKKQENDLVAMVDIYKRYAALFPSDSKKTDMEQDLKTLFYKNAAEQEQKNSKENLQKALNYYKNATDYGYEKNTVSKDITRVVSKLKRLATVQGNYGYFGFATDTQTPLGISFGGLKYKKLGFYMTAKINTMLFKSSKEYSEDAVKEQIKKQSEKAGVQTAMYNLSYSNIYGDLPAEKHGAANLTLGLTKGISYPLWVYAGVGVAYVQPLYEVRTTKYDSSGSSTDATISLGYYTNPDETEKTIRPVVEAGAIYKLGGFYLNAGIRTDLDGVYLSGGLGFAF
ncbi:hypothetical protein FACS189413_13960 [Bacteroidia bacterium]|nr:hypothetical protein FACS189413_13960 [Bacteroidia bacterium]